MINRGEVEIWANKVPKNRKTGKDPHRIILELLGEDVHNEQFEINHGYAISLALELKKIVLHRESLFQNKK